MMTPRERTVLRAIARALHGKGTDDMDALALSYPIPNMYSVNATIQHRAVVFLLALVVMDEGE